MRLTLFFICCLGFFHIIFLLLEYQTASYNYKLCNDWPETARLMELKGINVSNGEKIAILDSLNPNEV